MSGRNGANSTGCRVACDGVYTTKTAEKRAEDLRMTGKYRAVYVFDEKRKTHKTIYVAYK